MKDNTKFVIVKSLSGYHIINLSLIKSVSNMQDSSDNKSKIRLIAEEDEAYYSTEDQETIFYKIKEALL